MRQFILLLILSSLQYISASCVDYGNHFKVCDEELLTEYHVCNNKDAGSLFPFKMLNKVFTGDIRVVNTDMTVNGNELIFTPYNKTTENMCLLDNTIMESGNIVQYTPCLTCKCELGYIECRNKCSMSERDAYQVNPIESLDYKRTVIEKEHYLMCKNELCSISGCERCTRELDGREVCLKCMEPYYLYNRNPYVCFSPRELLIDCKGFVQYNPTERTASCPKCFNGNKTDTSNKTLINANTNEYIYGSCTCIDGHYGINCDLNKDEFYCGKPNMIYDEHTHICINQYRDECSNGLYMNNTCYCNHGYYGKKCEQKISCIYGNLRHNKCICYSGFSGLDCSIPYFDTREPNVLLESTISHKYERLCLEGWYGDNCNKHLCMNGQFNTITKQCECMDGFYGSYCQNSCEEECNYNGNKCNYKQECDCINGFYGVSCQYKNADYNVNYYNTTFEVSIENILVEQKTCLTQRCFQFGIHTPPSTRALTVSSYTPFTINNYTNVNYYNRNNKTVASIKIPNGRSLFLTFLSTTPEYKEETYIYPNTTSGSLEDGINNNRGANPLEKIGMYIGSGLIVLIIGTFLIGLYYKRTSRRTIRQRPARKINLKRRYSINSLTVKNNFTEFNYDISEITKEPISMSSNPMHDGHV